MYLFYVYSLQSKKSKTQINKKGQKQNIYNTKKYQNQNRITKKYLAAKRELEELTLIVTEQRIE